MPKATTSAEAAASNPPPQTMNLTDRTAPRQLRAHSAQLSDSDPTSSSGSSSEDDSESEDEEHSDHAMNGTGTSNTRTNATDSSSLPHIAGRPKPRIHRLKGDSGLLSRLNAFLPQMKVANEDLERQIAAGKAGDLILDNADESGEQYIEMDLGLGVLEEKRDGESSSEDESEVEGPNGTNDAGKKSQDMNDSDIIGKLMGGKGKKSTTDKPSIEEMAE
ncbi:hypothetical protein N7457_008409 [Penicillium paradoxum]|uniref:uncharacterized protein n=1 Tax=Penicillium paradoxum TaxID=176176 RepID=UPI0025469993|nr:uncharacterized protein N7457_008409 [Penicillium paradoxum]KAJ5773513.1 hypothetical protein N7457_008409 [Penicillium paradoxum]